MRNRVVNHEIIVGNIGENTALNPFVQAERFEVRRWFRLAFRTRQRTQLMPFAPVRQLFLKFRTFDVSKEIAHAAGEEGNIIVIEAFADDVCRMRANRAADIDDTADHADAGTFAEDRVELSTVIAADNSLAAAHELKRERADILQNPEFRFLIERVVLHQRARTRTAAAADEDFAARGAVTGRIAGITLDGNSVFGRHIEPVR